MTKVEHKSNLMYKCNVCDKPYIKKGALTNHLKKVHNLSMSPTKKEFMDISSNSDFEKDLNTENEVMLDCAKELDVKDDDNELEIMLGMKSTISFDASVLTRASKTEGPAKVITILSSSDNGKTEEPSKSVPLCSPAAKFLSESQKKILITDIQESEDEDIVVTKTTPRAYTCEQCKKTFTKKDDFITHMKSTHTQKHSSAGDQKCVECSYRTNFAANLLHHLLNTHADKELAKTLKRLKPVNSAVIYMLAEQNMALVTESKQMRKDLNYIKKALEPKSRAAKFNCQKCKDLCASPTRMQEHMLSDHCCKYCDKVFASKTEKEKHKKYMCKDCEITFSHSVELNIHSRTFHKEVTTSSKVLQFQCTECSHGERKEEDIIKHIETKHTAILSPANITKQVPSKKKPSVTKHEEYVHKCDKCLVMFHKKAELEEHVNKAHKIDNEACFDCPICSFTNTSEAEVFKHIESIHTEKCNICQSEFTCKSELENHTYSAHKNPKSSEKAHTIEKEACFDCPICSFSNTSEAEVFKHIESIHTEKCNICQSEFTCKSELKNHIDSAHSNPKSSNHFTCERCTHAFRSENELQAHMSKVHESKKPRTYFICDKCNKSYENQSDLNIHVGETHVSQANIKNTLLVADSHSKLQNPRLIEREALGGMGLFAPSFMQPRSGRAYCSSPEWPYSRFPENNLKDKVTELLSYIEHSQLIFGAPGNDISNIDGLESQVEQYRLAVKSSENCIAIAKQALKDFPKLEKVIIHERLPRSDHLADLSEYANFALSSLAEKSVLKNRISVVPMTELHYTTEEKMTEIFGSPTSRHYDGIHLRGKLGSQLYNKCLISAIRTAGIEAPRWSRSRSRSYKKEQGQEQEAIPTTTSNRFSALSN